MTVTDLKKALKVRGLTTTGVKQDLIERLQLAMATDEADPNNDSDLLDDANELLGDDDDEIVVPAPTTPAAGGRRSPSPYYRSRSRRDYRSRSRSYSPRKYLDTLPR